MTAFSKVSCARFALSATLLACACERDSEALFDDSMLTGQSGGGSGPAAAGSQGNPIAGDGGDASSAGGAETAGSSSEAGTGGSSAGGSEMGGTSAGGAATAGGAGKPGAGDGGSSGSGGSGGMGGTGGSKDPPMPVTVVISAFDDSYISSCMPYSNYGSAVSLNIDDDNNCVYQALLNPVLKELPEGAIVSQAKLTLYCINSGGALALNYVDDAWSESEVRYTGRPDVGTSIGNVTCKDKGPATLDLTTVIQVWLTGQHPAYGIYVRTEATDGTDFASSEAVDAETRPSLTVTYTLAQK